MGVSGSGYGYCAGKITYETYAQTDPKLCYNINYMPDGPLCGQRFYLCSRIVGNGPDLPALRENSCDGTYALYCGYDPRYTQSCR